MPVRAEAEEERWLRTHQSSHGNPTDFLAHLRPVRAYLSIPTRSPVEEWVRPPGEDAINRAYQILSESVEQVEYLIGYEGNAFAFTGDVEEDLPSITAVHPMQAEAVGKLLARARADWLVVHRLIAEGQFVGTAYEGCRFYVRKPHGRRARSVKRHASYRQARRRVCPAGAPG